jgi:hypothetical protein
MNTKNYGNYDSIFNAHRVALELGWIVRIGFDSPTKRFWIEYVGRAA